MPQPLPDTRPAVVQSHRVGSSTRFTRHLAQDSSTLQQQLEVIDSDTNDALTTLQEQLDELNQAYAQRLTAAAANPVSRMGCVEGWMCRLQALCCGSCATPFLHTRLLVAIARGELLSLPRKANAAATSPMLRPHCPYCSRPSLPCHPRLHAKLSGQQEAEAELEQLYASLTQSPLTPPPHPQLRLSSAGPAGGGAARVSGTAGAAGYEDACCRGQGQCSIGGGISSLWHPCCCEYEQHAVSAAAAAAHRERCCGRQPP